MILLGTTQVILILLKVIRGSKLSNLFLVYK
nr:MAG TPA: hypothetical protein [Caudoviricetes sp.]